VVEQVNEELALYWAQTTLLSLTAEEDPEDLGESFKRGDDLLVLHPRAERTAQRQTSVCPPQNAPALRPS
jgi:hypothetical protein